VETLVDISALSYSFGGKGFINSTLSQFIPVSMSIFLSLKA